MQQIALWQVLDQAPQRLTRGAIDFEKRLHTWIQQDPTLLQRGLTIVGSGIRLDAGEVDLLALDPQGRWVVIEIKRGRTRRRTVAQAVDYAACLATMPYHDLSERLGDYLRQHEISLEALLEERGAEEDPANDERDVMMYVVGTGKDPSLDRMVEYLSSFEVPINVVSYDVFELEGGQQVLVRELTESEAEPITTRKVTVDELCARADSKAIGWEFRMILEAAQKHGIHPRPSKNAIMYTPPSNRARSLFTAAVWTRADGLQRLWVWPEAFSEFYPVSEDDARSILGEQESRGMRLSEVEEFVGNLDELFERIGQEEAESEQ